MNQKEKRELLDNIKDTKAFEKWLEYNKVDNTLWSHDIHSLQENKSNVQGFFRDRIDYRGEPETFNVNLKSVVESMTALLRTGRIILTERSFKDKSGKIIHWYKCELSPEMAEEYFSLAPDGVQLEHNYRLLAYELATEGLELHKFAFDQKPKEEAPPKESIEQ